MGKIYKYIYIELYIHTRTHTAPGTTPSAGAKNSTHRGVWVPGLVARDIGRHEHVCLPQASRDCLRIVSGGCRDDVETIRAVFR